MRTYDFDYVPASPKQGGCDLPAQQMRQENPQAEVVREEPHQEIPSVYDWKTCATNTGSNARGERTSTIEAIAGTTCGASARTSISWNLDPT